jgi:hypothetical protein
MAGWFMILILEIDYDQALFLQLILTVAIPEGEEISCNDKCRKFEWEAMLMQYETVRVRKVSQYAKRTWM